VIIPMLLLSGGSTPLDSMPQWLQWVMQVRRRHTSSALAPRSCSAMRAERGVAGLAGAGAIGLLFFAIALMRFRKSLAS
jgi:ABC-2 type transport system permease protein